jgi:hypothetical protein
MDHETMLRKLLIHSWYTRYQHVLVHFGITKRIYMF